MTILSNHIRRGGRTARLGFALVCLTVLVAAQMVMDGRPAQSGTDPTVSSVEPPKLCFSPEGHCSTLLLDAIARARVSIRVQAYSFTADEIADALIAANHRGVDVSVIVDKSQTSERYSVLPMLNRAAIPVYVDYCCAIAHNKVMVIDNRFVVTGSYNFTRAADLKNAENLLILDDALLAQSYLANWDHHRQGAERLAQR
jgi:phosphatidylserine/phosphatidylglycerophosphate/cardiolipin synthase-like enzyme